MCVHDTEAYSVVGLIYHLLRSITFILISISAVLIVVAQY